MERVGGEWAKYTQTGEELMVAVIEEFAHLHAAGLKPSAEYWTSNEAYYQQIRRAIVSRWCRLTEFAYQRFPFCDDHVRWAWLSFRKLELHEREKVISDVLHMADGSTRLPFHPEA